MSQSPLEANASPESALRYNQGWKALNRLLHEDRSFSGNERNCAYLNCGGKGFADISAATGFDFPDDARAVVATDWDLDGDLDLWMTCRTAPRVRLLENRSKTVPESWLAVRLEGDGKKVNRDAIGARVEVWLEGEQAPLTRTNHGGDAFLSQSSAWLHFGMGAGAKPVKVVVRWPGGDAEEVTGIEAGGFFDIRMGSGKAARWQPPSGIRPLVAAPQIPLPDDDAARIILTARLPLPSLPGLEDAKGPLLVNLWSATCAPCVAELAEWSAGIDALRGAGLRVLALNVDGDAGAGKRYPFDRGIAGEDVIRGLDLFQRGVLDRWMSLPVPSSFLIDKEGRVAAIYKGPVAVDQLLKDAKLLDSAPDFWRTAALPFPGKFLNPPPKPQPMRVASQFVDANLPLAGLDYLERYASRYETEPDVLQIIELLRSELRPDPGPALLAKADALRDAGDATGAMAAYRDTLRQSSRTIAAAEHLAWLLATHPDPALRVPAEALALADRLCEISKRGNPAYLDLLGAAQAANGDFAGAEKSAGEALALFGDSPEGAPVRERLALYREGKTFVKE